MGISFIGGFFYWGSLYFRIPLLWGSLSVRLGASLWNPLSGSGGCRLQVVGCVGGCRANRLRYVICSMSLFYVRERARESESERERDVVGLCGRSLRGNGWPRHTFSVASYSMLRKQCVWAENGASGLRGTRGSSLVFLEVGPPDGLRPAGSPKARFTSEESRYNSLWKPDLRPGSIIAYYGAMWCLGKGASWKVPLPPDPQQNNSWKRGFLEVPPGSTEQRH